MAPQPPWCPQHWNAMPANDHAQCIKWCAGKMFRSLPPLARANIFIMKPSSRPIKVDTNHHARTRIIAILDHTMLVIHRRQISCEGKISKTRCDRVSNPAQITPRHTSPPSLTQSPNHPADIQLHSQAHHAKLIITVKGVKTR